VSSVLPALEILLPLMGAAILLLYGLPEESFKGFLMCCIGTGLFAIAVWQIVGYLLGFY
jgi:hypothetical protein